MAPEPISGVAPERCGELLVRHLGGSGPRLVLIHGLGGDHRFWNGFAATLIDCFEVVAVDLPGHGASPKVESLAAAHPRGLADSVARALVAMGWDRPHVAGLSLGGWVALELAASGQVASATAFAPAGTWSRPPSRWALRAEYALTRVLRAAGPRRQWVTRIPYVVPAIAGAQLCHPERFGPAELYNEIEAMGHAVGYREIAMHLRQDHFRRGSSIEVPTGVGYGADDRILGGKARQALSLLPTHAEVVDFPDCNHGVTVDQPDLARDLLLRTVALAPAPLAVDPR